MIPDDRRDEIGDLSRAFNTMTTDLKNVTASKAELETEVAERKQAQAETARLLAERSSLFERLQTTLMHVPAGAPGYSLQPPVPLGDQPGAGGRGLLRHLWSQR